MNIPQRFGGTGEDMWMWMLCDAPTLAYALLTMGLGDDARVQRAVEHLVGLVDDNGWRCVSAPELGKFRGPGRKADPCPIVNVYALKALAQVPELLDSPATRTGTEMLLWHWEHQTERKIYLFGIGTTFRKLKYPFVWYDVLHVVDAIHLSKLLCERILRLARQTSQPPERVVEIILPQHLLAGKDVYRVVRGLTIASWNIRTCPPVPRPAGIPHSVWPWRSRGDLARRAQPHPSARPLPGR